MKKKYKFHFLTLFFSFFFVVAGSMFVSNVAQAQVVTNTTNPILIRQQKIAELWQLLGEIIKELNIIIAEQKTQVINKASSDTSTTTNSTSSPDSSFSTTTNSSSSMSSASSSDSNSDSSMSPASSRSMSPASSGGSGGGGAGGNLPFGGKVTAMRYCTCTPGYWLIDIDPPKSGLPIYLMYNQAVATTYSFNKIPAEGVYLLGTYGVIMQCLQLAYPYCRRDGQGVNVIMVGTSK